MDQDYYCLNGTMLDTWPFRPKKKKKKEKYMGLRDKIMVGKRYISRRKDYKFISWKKRKRYFFMVRDNNTTNLIPLSF